MVQSKASPVRKVYYLLSGKLSSASALLLEAHSSETDVNSYDYARAKKDEYSICIFGPRRLCCCIWTGESATSTLAGGSILLWDT